MTINFKRSLFSFHLHSYTYIHFQHQFVMQLPNQKKKKETKREKHAWQYYKSNDNFLCIARCVCYHHGEQKAACDVSIQHNTHINAHRLRQRALNAYRERDMETEQQQKKKNKATNEIKSEWITGSKSKSDLSI